MIQRGDRLGFLQKSSPFGFVALKTMGEELESYGAVQFAVMGFVDYSHVTLPDSFDYTIVRNCLTCHSLSLTDGELVGRASPSFSTIL
jgi:hypothetical protein